MMTEKILFAKTFGCVRMVYNHWLDERSASMRNKTNVTYTIYCKRNGCNEEKRKNTDFKGNRQYCITTITRHRPCGISELFQTAENRFPKVQISDGIKQLFNGLHQWEHNSV